MKILFITSTRLGDGVLSLGALDYFIVKYPEAQITVACGPLLCCLFTPIPNITEIIPLKKQRFAGHWFKLAKATFGTRWDIVVDLRNTLLSRLLWSKEKYIWGGQAKHNHKVEQIAEVIGAEIAPAPRLWFDRATTENAKKLIPAGGPVLAIGPTANWLGKQWPAENFITLVQILTSATGILPNARVLVLAAPGEEHTAYKVLESIPQDRRIDMIAKGSPLDAAAAIGRANFYVGNDSGLTHVAAAMKVPTLALFGYGWPEQYRPWGKNAAYVATPEKPDELLKGRTASEITTSLMDTLTVTAAVEAAVDLWAKTRK